MNPLQELIVNRRAELGLSLRRAADKSGGLVSHTTLNQIELGRDVMTRRSDEALRGIALALDLPLSKVTAAADQPMPQATEFRMPKKAARLTPRQRKAILAMVDALLEEQTVGG